MAVWIIETNDFFAIFQSWTNPILLRFYVEIFFKFKSSLNSELFEIEISKYLYNKYEN